MQPCASPARRGRICKPRRGRSSTSSAWGGRTGSAEFTIGGAVNAALLNLTKALADRGVQDGVRVNAINPGSIVTERLQTRIRNFAKQNNMDPEEAMRQMPRQMKIARFGEPA